jgi:hypothetical protein
MTQQLSIEEIKAKLMWFHGEEFDKYPFIESTQTEKNSNNS